MRHPHRDGPCRQLGKEKTKRLQNPEGPSTIPAKSWKQAEGAAGQDGGSQNQTCLSGQVEGGGNLPMARHMMRSGERGQAIIEYVFILVLVAMVVIVVLLIFGPQLGNAFSSITKSI